MVVNYTPSFSTAKSPIINISDLSKFITIDDTQLKLSDSIPKFNPTKKLVVISFLGKAKIGKSTLMNCFVSYLKMFNSKIFNTSRSAKSHCTLGIDILTIETDTKTIVLLDIQGMDFQDSKNDCKLIVFVFMISNIIIYNEKGILTNSVLSSFQALTCLVTHIKDNHDKPMLIFRSIDIDSELEDYDPNKNLEDMLSDERNDQYTSARKSIKKLFTNIYCKPTYTIEKKERAQFNADNFIEVMSNQENGFSIICNYIYEKINISQSIDPSIFIKRVTDVLMQINSNKKIDCKIFDLTSAQSELAIRNWEEQYIDTSKYNSIIVDGSQEIYDLNVVPIIEYRNTTLHEFDTLFSMATPSIRKERRNLIKNKFDAIIADALKISKQISLSELENVYNNKILNRFDINIIDPRDDFNTWSDKTFGIVKNKENYIVSDETELAQMLSDNNVCIISDETELAQMLSDDKYSENDVCLLNQIAIAETIAEDGNTCISEQIALSNSVNENHEDLHSDDDCLQNKCFIDNNKIPIKKLYDSFINETKWLDCIKQEFLNKITDLITKNICNIKTIFLKEQQNFNKKIVENLQLIDKFIKNNNLMSYVSDIKISFSMAVKTQIDEFINDIENKWYYKNIIVSLFPKVNILTNYKPHILLDSTTYSSLLVSKLSNYIFNNKKMHSNLVKSIDSECEVFSNVIHNYLYNIYENKFMVERSKQLPELLDTVQRNLNTSSELLQCNYIILKKLHYDIKNMYTEIINGGNDVYFLNLFDHLEKYITLYTQAHQLSGNALKLFTNSVLVKYVFLVNTTPINKIYIKSKFDELYEDVKPYYNLLKETNNEEEETIIFNYQLVTDIIDILFRKHITKN